MDNNKPEAPVIPAGTDGPGGAAYDPLAAAQAAGQPENGQAPSLPGKDQVGGDNPPAAPEAPQRISFETLAAKKGFKSPDDLAAAYENLESQNKRVEMGLSELAKIREQEQPEDEPNVGAAETQPVATQEDAIKVVEKIVRKVTGPLQTRLELQDLFLNHPDARDIASQIGKAVKDNPGISWEGAYKIAKFDIAQVTAREEGRKEGYQAAQQKQAAAVGSGASSRKDATSIVDLIHDRNIPFVEIQRIMRERFSV